MENMEVEKKRSKGGLLNLLDWNGKSRKKLFANNSELPGLMQGKENVENSSKSRPHLKLEACESGESSSKTESSYWNCSSSVISDDRYGNRAPGLVARLMGLDSLPSSHIPKPNSTQFFESIPTSKSSHYEMLTNNFHSEHHDTVDYLNMPYKPERYSWNKLQNKPIERFQTESLPPKSAKSISITHHKLLSPIKSPGFIPTRDSAYIVEAAAKIIESSPQRKPIKSKVSSIGPPSVSLRIRDLKERVEAAQKTSTRPNRPRAGMGPASMNTEKRSFDSSRNKGKSVPLAEKAKVNVSGRGGSTKDQNEVKVKTPILKSQPTMQKTKRKSRSSLNGNDKNGVVVLRQNNQKQNSLPNKEKSISKVSASNHPGRRKQPIGSSKSSNKVVDKEFSPSKGKNKKGSVNEAVNLDQRTDDSNAVIHTKSTEIVSFTFTSPLKRSSVPEFESFGESNGSNSKRNLFSYYPGMNAVQGDALSFLLDQKLQELACRIESSSSSSSRSDVVRECMFSTSSLSNLHDISLMKFEKLEGQCEYEPPSSDRAVLNSNQQLQVVEEMEEPCTSNSGTFSTLEPSYENEIFSDDDSANYCFLSSYCEPEISDTASSSSLAIDKFTKHHHLTTTTLITSTNSTTRNIWELKYITDILRNVDIALENASPFGDSPGIINTNLFDHLEIEENSMESDQSKLGRKVLFDYVNESLESKCREVTVGLFNGSGQKWEAILGRKDWLGEQVYKEVMEWQCIGELMVDELVDRDMSTKHGRWVDFNIQVFEEGVEIEKSVLSSLVDQLVSDLLICN